MGTKGMEVVMMTMAFLSILFIFDQVQVNIYNFFFFLKERDRVGEGQRENIKQAPHLGQSPVWDSISRTVRS